MILMPSYPGKVDKVDPEFEKEYRYARDIGHNVYLFDHDEFVGDESFISNIRYSGKHNALIRGWMLNKEQYKSLYERLEKVNIKLINTPDQYLNTHYYPKAYDYIKEHAANSTWFVNLSDESIIENRRKIETTHIKDIIVKDFVKSEKGVEDIFILKKDLPDDEFIKRIRKFVEVRGKLFNEGVVFKEVVELKKFGRSKDVTNEWRIFINNKRVISESNNSNYPYSSGKFIDWNVIDSIKNNIDSMFYTIDVAETEDGKMIILETGDGQVSGLATSQNLKNLYGSIRI